MFFLLLLLLWGKRYNIATWTGCLMGQIWEGRGLLCTVWKPEEVGLDIGLAQYHMTLECSLVILGCGLLSDKWLIFAMVVCLLYRGCPYLKGSVIGGFTVKESTHVSTFLPYHVQGHATPQQCWLQTHAKPYLSHPQNSPELSRIIVHSVIMSFG